MGAATGCLLVKNNLSNYGLKVDLLCPICTNGIDSVDHILLEYGLVRVCWSKLDIAIIMALGICFVDLLEFIWEQMSSDGKGKVAFWC